MLKFILIVPLITFLLSWREGVVKEKNKNDETTLTIDFPGMRYPLLRVNLFSTNYILTLMWFNEIKN